MGSDDGNELFEGDENVLRKGKHRVGDWKRLKISI